MTEFITDLSFMLERYLNSLQNFITTCDRLKIILLNLKYIFDKFNRILEVTSCVIEFIHNILQIIYVACDFLVY